MPKSRTKDEASATETYAKFIAEPFEAGYGHTALLDRLRARVPSEVAPETLLCRRSYRQAVQPGIKLPLHNFEPMSAHQTLVGLFNRFFESEPGSGLMFWFKQKKFLGSYFFLTAMSRS